MRRADREFSEFAASAQQRLYRQAFLLAGEPEAARDLVQAALLKVYLAWSRIDSPVAYARQVLLREYLAGRRRRDKERGAARLLHPRPEQPVTPASDRGEAVTLLAALGELAPRMRAVVVLRFWEDLSVHQTAELLGCTEGTVKSATSKGLAHLRERLGDTYPTHHEEITT